MHSENLRRQQHQKAYHVDGDQEPGISPLMQMQQRMGRAHPVLSKRDKKGGAAFRKKAM